MPLQRVLVVDDDSKMLSLMKRGLPYAGYTVELSSDGKQALAAARDDPPDLVVLDVMLPGLDGLEVCRRLRTGSSELPVLMLTARDRMPDWVAGLDAYLVEPFAFDELLARIRALLRPAPRDERGWLRFADLALSPATREVARGTRGVELTAREYELLEFVLRHPRQVLARELIFARVWGSDHLGESNVIEVCIMHLREKLELAGEPRLIHTVRGAGDSLCHG